MAQLTFTRKRQVRGRKSWNRMRRWAKHFGFGVENSADPMVVAKIYGRRNLWQADGYIRGR